METPKRKLLSEKAQSLLGQFDAIAETVKFAAEDGPFEKEIRSFIVSVTGMLKRDCKIQDWKQDFPSTDHGSIWVQLYPKAWELRKVGPVAFCIAWNNPFASQSEDLYVGLRIPWNWLHVQGLKSVTAPHVPADFTDVTDIEDPDRSDAFWRYLRFQDYVQDSRFNVEGFYQAILAAFSSLLSLRPIIDEYISRCSDGPETRTARRDLGVVAVLDTETAGLKQELIELAVINAAYDKQTGEVLGILEQYEGLREPKCGISNADQRLNGLGSEQVRGKQLDEERIRSLLTRADFVVAHKASFDQKRLEEQFGWAVDLLKDKWRDSLDQVAWKTDSRDLQSLLTHHKIDCEVAHRAGPDARALLELLSYGGSGSYLSQLMSVIPDRKA